ncbi:hypothetical protein H5410_031158 [Solanum commersonii]|uniref:Uncharacterized protein n=1 Tax=Solanum commersonii TaxID=4109 RepID=A0A9J5YKV5_SOLCO|nr:hypothetical protein H5410_031158 [Solanum commersonii]
MPVLFLNMRIKLLALSKGLTKPTGQFLNLTKKRTNLTHSKSHIYCGLFVVAYTEFLSDGLHVPSYEISSKTFCMRYASLL